MDRAPHGPAHGRARRSFREGAPEAAGPHRRRPPGAPASPAGRHRLNGARDRRREDPGGSRLSPAPGPGRGWVESRGPPRPAGGLPRTMAHSVTLLGTGLIAEFYANTLAKRGRERIGM